MGASTSTCLDTHKPVVFKYINVGEIGGRGGVVRFFLLAHNISFTEELYAMGDEWLATKQRLVESGENPAGTVPIVQYGDKSLTQHISIMRYIAQQRGLLSGADGDQAQDAVAEEYATFRAEWGSAAFGSDEELKSTFKKLTVPAQLRMFDALYDKLKQHDVFLSATAGRPLWGDCAVFGLVRDLTLTGMLEEAQLIEYPRLKAMYDAFGAQPAVAEWIAAHKVPAMA